VPPLSNYRAGPVGNLQRLPPPGNGVEATPEKIGGAHELLSGGRSYDVAGIRRTFKMSWTYLEPADWIVLEALFLGVYGPEPYVLLDPARVNLLTANQSSGTETAADSSGYAVQGVGTITSSAVLANTGVRSLLWAHPSAAIGAGGVQTTGGAYGTTGTPATDTPVVPTLTYTGSLYARAVAGAAAVNMQASLQWYTAAGVFVSASTGTAQSVTNAAWVQLTASAAAPSTAAVARLQISNTAAIPAAHPGFYLDDWQLQDDPAATAWTPGTGVPRVHFDSLTDSTPKMGWRNADAVFAELGAT
jgi:hypothetical protein